MKILSPLIKVISKCPKPEAEFEQLIKQLFINDGLINGYTFEKELKHEYGGNDGFVEKNYPEIECPVVFKFLWADKEIHCEPYAQEIINSIERVLNSRTDVKSFILVTPNDLKDSEKDWLKQVPQKYGIEIDISSFRFAHVEEKMEVKISVFHYGNSIIQILLDRFTALRKYYYGLDDSETFIDFNLLNEKYRNSVFDEYKHLSFIGLPTGHYQKQTTLYQSDLINIYIPLEFSEEINKKKTSILNNIYKKSNCFIVLGHPGTGKSTFIKYLALINSQNSKSKNKFGGKIPFVITIRNFVRFKQQHDGNLSFIDYLKYYAETNYGFENIDKDFYIAMLSLGKATVLFDGLDEVSSAEGRANISKSILKFSHQFPDCTIWVTSRIVGYTDDVKLDSEQFKHYYLAQVTDKQSNKFIEDWYNIQIPQNIDFRNERIDSLKKAIIENKGVLRLKRNPLLLTMMTLVHQFEGTLPEDRAKLYEKCIELLLKTWQEQKYLTLGIKNPLEERNIKYDTQLKFLSETAFYIQNQDQDMKDEDTRGLIEESTLLKVLFNTRYDERRMTEPDAKEDVRIFLDYIRDRAGLFVEKGISKNQENLFAFVHLSFLEYLCAYKIAEDKSKSQKEHIDFLLQYIGVSTWEEIILLALYIFSKSTGPSFIDSFAEEIFSRIKDEENQDVWFLLGRAICDNIDFAIDDYKRIIINILHIWLKDTSNKISYSLLKEIYYFSKKGKNLIKEVIIENLSLLRAEQAYESLNFYNKYFGIDSIIIKQIEKNTDKINFLPYLPVYRNIEIIKNYIQKNLKEKDWVIYYNSIKENLEIIIEKVLNNKFDEYEIKGYILSSVSKILKTFYEKNKFLKINKEYVEKLEKYRSIKYIFPKVKTTYPLTLFRSFKIDAGDISIKRLKNLFVNLETKNKNEQAIDKSNNFDFGRWTKKILESAFSIFDVNKDGADEFNIKKERYLNEMSSDFNKDYHHYLSKYFDENFVRDFSRYIMRDLERYSQQNFSKHFKDYFNKEFIRDFNIYFTKNFNINFNKYFNRYFNRKFIQNFNQAFIVAFIQDFIRDLIPNFKKILTSLFEPKFRKSLNWRNISTIDLINIYEVINDEFEKGNFNFIEEFYNAVYKYIFYDGFEASLQYFEADFHNFVDNEYIEVQNNYLTFKNPFLIPFTLNFVLMPCINNYFINIFADLNKNFSDKKEINLNVINNIIKKFIDRNPFIAYLINFSWDFYARDFNEKYDLDVQKNYLLLSAFIINAAKVSQIAGVPCSGREWEKILKKAEEADDIFVKLSLTLYHLCCFENREENSKALDNLLAELKENNPEYYKLIGFAK